MSAEPQVSHIALAPFEIYDAFATQFPYALIALSPDLDMTWTSPGVTKVMGYGLEELVGSSVFGIIHPDDLEMVAPMALAMVSQADQLTDEHSAARGAEIDVRVMHRNGTWVHVAVTGRVIDRMGNIVVVVREAAERAALGRVIERIGLGATLEDSFRAVVDLANANFATDRAAIVCDLDGLSIVTADDSSTTFDPEQLLAAVRDEDRTSATVAEVDGHWATPIESAYGDVVGVIVLPATRAGGPTPFDIEIVGRVQQLAAVAVTRALDDRALRRDATFDHLTGLVTRREFERALTGALARTDSGPVTLLFIDLDGFKKVNDLHGHTFGDAVLAASATRLREAVRAVDLVGRLGGDEFGVLLRATSGDEAQLLAERVRHALSRPIEIDHLELRVSGSVGLATTEEPIAVTELIRRADSAMYAAKSRR